VRASSSQQKSGGINIMGRRNYWDAVRMVAENIHDGDRSFSNLLKIPDLPTSGWEAIRELQKRGLITVADSRVEPTPAFWPWIDELRTAETQQATARQEATSAPRKVPAPAPEPSNPPAAAVPVVPDALIPHFFTRRWCFSTKYGRRRITNREFMCESEMCLRILDFLRHHGCHVTSSDLRRGLNAYRYPEHYQPALQELLRLKALKLEKEPGTRRQWVTLVKIPREFKVKKAKPQRRRHKPRSRGRTAWFERLMIEQELDD
jgi:hypothetical protein